jgi:translation initiation factor 4A
MASKITTGAGGGAGAGAGATAVDDLDDISDVIIEKKTTDIPDSVDLTTDGVKAYVSFDDMDIPTDILRGIYNIGWEKPSPIQQKGIMPMIEGKDIIGHAQSGTGKTGTFVIGSLPHIDISKEEIQVLVLEPVREIAQQSAKVATIIGEHMGLKVYCATGGPPVSKDIEKIEKGVHFLVGTPGRIYDLMNRKVFNAKSIKILILDEADQMLESRFREQVLHILNMGFSNTTQVALFSATMPEEIRKVADKMCVDPVKILLPPEKVTLDGISQYFVYLERDSEKLITLIDLYENLTISQAIIYVRTRHQAEWLADQMDKNGFKLQCIHGDMDEAERKVRMDNFIAGTSRVLIATDMLARGIDIQQISTVINYELPDDDANYIHRIGRTGRYGRKGVSINLVTDKDIHRQKQIETFYKTTIKDLPADLKTL